MTSHSFDMASNYLLDKTLNNLLLDAETIKQIKKNYGLNFFQICPKMTLFLMLLKIIRTDYKRNRINIAGI